MRSAFRFAFVYKTDQSSNLDLSSFSSHRFIPSFGCYFFSPFLISPFLHSRGPSPRLGATNFCVHIKIIPIGSAKMNHCTIQQKSVVRSREDVRSSVSSSAASTWFTPDHLNRREALVCPKPRRVGLLNGTINDPSSSLRRHLSHQSELSDSQARFELLDIILSKGEHGSERAGISSSKQVGSSPPFFCGSPPNRVSNPLIQDTRFREEKIIPLITAGYYPPPSPGLTPTLSPNSAAARKGGYVRVNFGNNPAVRVEGFDCLDRDRSRNCSIPALG